jgi:hypothetical protein
LDAERSEIDRERRDFDRDRLVLGFGDAFGIGDAAQAGGPLEMRTAVGFGDALRGDVLETLSRQVLETFTGVGDPDLGSDGFEDPIGGGEQKFDSFDSIDSFDAKLKLICAYESSCSCDDSMPLTEEVEEWKKSLVSTDLTLQSMRGLTRSNQGIPRIREWSPIGATRKISRWATPATVYSRVT